MVPWTRLVAMLSPLVLGTLAGRAALFGDPRAAIFALNRYVLTLAFPALMFGAVARSAGAPPSAPFVLAHVALFAVVVGGAALLVRRVPDRDGRGAVGLCAAFGNVVYLGLPVADAALGAAHLPIAALSASLHMTLALTVGPVLLVRWGGAAAVSWRTIGGRIARQPLVWSPIAGLAARALPPEQLDMLWLPLEGLAASASPVALFLLGLYLWDNRSALARRATGLGAVLAMKLGLLPAAAIGLAAGLHAAGAIGAPEARVLVVLAAAPVAITTFAIAHDHRIGERTVAAGIVASTVLSLATFSAAIAAVHVLWP